MTPSLVNTNQSEVRSEPFVHLPAGHRRRRILVLDGTTNQALACVRSLGRAGHTVFVAATTKRPLAGWSNQCVGTYRLTSNGPEALASVRQRARADRVDLVLPLTERSCLLCDRERDAWRQSGIDVGCGPGTILLGAFDKQQTIETAQHADLRTPPTRFPTSLEECYQAAAEIGYPCVVKPRFSNAWDEQRQRFWPDHGVTYVQTGGELEQAVRTRRQGEHWPLLQGYVEGRGKGVFALVDHGRVVAWFAHQRLRDVRPTGSGSCLRQSVHASPRLRNPAERLLRQLNWHGPAMVEFRDDGVSQPFLIEVNGRFWASLQLAVLAGVDFPRLWVDLLSDRSVPTCASYREGLVLRWLWGDVKRFLYILAGKPTGYPRAFPSRWQGLNELIGRQPVGTRCEMWDVADLWPAIGEWVQGMGELIGRRQ